MHPSSESEGNQQANLQMTSFVGRKQELADIKRRLTDPACRLLTLVGPGGIGKTRLATQVTSSSAPNFPDGAFFINLQPVKTEEVLITTIADTLDIQLSGQESPLSRVHSYLVNKNILLTLDNFEQITETSPTLSKLLQGTQVKMLLTSRETLNLQEEWLYPLSGMNFPERKTSFDNLADYDAIQLFADRAKQVRPDFSIEAEIESVVRICQLVEGMPLALELAAPRLKSFSCSEIVAEIERNLDFLATRLRNIPERHHSLQAIFAQTWKDLSVQEQTVFQRLAVFRGGFLRNAAEAVAGASISLLSTFLDKSLLSWEQDSEGRGRYQIHELLRQFAEEKLSTHPNEATETLAQHAQYYSSFLDRNLDDLLGGGQREALLEIEIELNNIRAAWLWAVEQKEWSAINDALEAFHLFCDMQGRHKEGTNLLQRAVNKLLATVDEETRPLLGRLLSRYRFMQVYAPSPPSDMEADLNESLLIAKEQKNALETAFSLMALGGFTYYIKSNPKIALALFEQSLPLFREQVHCLYEARVLNWIGVVYPDQEGLVRYCQEGLKVAQSCGNKIDALMSLVNLAEAAMLVGDFTVAKAYCEEAINTADEMQIRVIATHIRTLLSLVLFMSGEWESAKQLVQESLIRSIELNNGTLIGYAEGFAGLYESMAGNYVQGRQLSQSSRNNPANHGLGLFVAHWGLTTALCSLESHDAAWEALRAGFQQTQAVDSIVLAMCLLPVTTILLHRRGKSEQAAKTLTLVSSHPFSQKGWLEKWELFQETQDNLKDEIEAVMTKAKSQSPEDAIVEIKGILGITSSTGEPADANQALIEPLTNRELEVLQLITDGLSNREIAGKLVISTGTAKYYTSQIYRKLQVTSRTQAAATARELGILD